MVTEISKIFGIGKQAVMQMNRQASLLYNTAGESIKEEETCNHMGNNGKENHMELSELRLIACLQEVYERVVRGLRHQDWRSKDTSIRRYEMRG